MAPSAELLINNTVSDRSKAMLFALRDIIEQAKVREAYKGDCDWLILYGVGAPARNAARKAHVASGRLVWLWDLAYFERQRYLRCSVNHDHPQQWLDRTPSDASRWDELKIKLRADYNADGPIILIGLGRKSRAYLNEEEWEQMRLKLLQRRFPGRKIIYRPKPGSPAMKLDCEMNAESPIEELIRGASLVSCRHSNAACDATIAGVPFECDDGAAMWLQARPYTVENRLDFLRRLAWWQWRPDEARQAWQFIQTVTSES